MLKNIQVAAFNLKYISDNTNKLGKYMSI